MGKRISGKRKKLNTEDLKQMILKERKKYYHKIPSNIYKSFQVDELMESGCRCYRITPLNDFNGVYIVYLYGGGMCHNISLEQWDFIIKLAEKTGVGLFVPMYPLAPENCCRELFAMLEKAYAHFTKGIDVEKVILMGDSTGAGLCLSLSMLAWKEGHRKPDQMIFLSPCLDTEFFDKELEEEILACSVLDDKYYYDESVKDFLNTYWVKDYAVRTEYTSPFYEDYMDLCDDIVVFTSVEDMYHCYAKAFYNKAKKQHIPVRFYEFEAETHNFIIHSKSPEQKKAFGYLTDVIAKTYQTSLYNIYPLKMLSDWTKKYPDMIKDEWASKFIYDNKFDFSKMNTKISQYKNLLMASTYHACDEKVRQFIRQYPNGTIINLGCSLDNMFERVDNGRIQWYSIDTHNTMSVRRAMYGERKREKTIGRRLTDFTWMDEINYVRNQGLMFVCNETLSYLTLNQVKEMFEHIHNKFSGAQFVFTTTTQGAALYTNIRYRRSVFKNKKRRTYINDSQKVFNSWRSDYKIMAEEPVMKYLEVRKGLNLKTKIAKNYNLITYNHKLIHLRIGNEVYELKV